MQIFSCSGGLVPLTPALLKGQLRLLTLLHLSEAGDWLWCLGWEWSPLAPFVTTCLLKHVTFQTTAEASESPPGHRK